MRNGGCAKCPIAKPVAGVICNGCPKGVQGKKFVNVECESKTVTEEEIEDNDKKHDRLLSLIGLLLLRSKLVSVRNLSSGSGMIRVLQRSICHVPTPFHNPVNAVIEEDQADERNYSLYQKSSQIDVENDVDVI